MLVDLHLQGRLDLGAFVTETIAPDGVEQAFARMKDGTCCGLSSRLSDPEPSSASES